MNDFAHAEIARIQRLTAELTVTPQVVIQGNQISVTIEPYEQMQLERNESGQSGRSVFRLKLIGDDGKLLQLENLGELVRLKTHTFEFPFEEGFHREYQVILEAQQETGWQVVAYENVTYLKGFCDEISGQINRLNEFEQETTTTEPWWKEVAHRKEQINHQRIWAALAFANDLLERAKHDPPSGVEDLKNRLNQLKEMTVKIIKDKEDPFAGQTGYQLRGYRSEMNQLIQPYSLYVPEVYTSEKQWPLVVMLHGAWSNHHLALRRVFGLSNKRGENDFQAKRSMPELPDVPYLVVAPNGYETMSYEGFAEKDVFTVMDEVSSMFNVDFNRVYLTGLSMGGGGTFKIGLRHPGMFAAIAPVCGYVYASVRVDPEEQGPPSKEKIEDAFAPIEIAENALHLPIKMMHGDADGAVPVTHSETMHEKLQELGYQSELEVYPGVGHDAWVPGYEDDRIFDWFSKFERDPNPDHVIYKTGNPQGGSAYWVSIDEPAEIRTLARIEAHAEEGKVSVQTENVKRLTLNFVHDYFFRRDSIKVAIDGQFVNEGAYQTETRSYIRKNGEWLEFREETEDRLLPGFHGLHEAWDHKHVYAYSTEGSTRSNQLAQTYALLKSVPQGYEDVQWPVIAENNLSDEIMAENHIVLFAQIGGSDYLKKAFGENEAKPFADPKKLLGDWTLKPEQAMSVILPNPLSAKRYVQLNLAYDEGMQALKTFAQIERSLHDVVRPDLIIYKQDGSVAGMGLFNKKWELDTFDWVNE